MKRVRKKWGREVWIVNEEYCGKLLMLDKCANSSTHYHKTKKETFLCLLGCVTLTVDEVMFSLQANGEPITILPNTSHSFYGKEKSVILEISTHHEEDDVVRLSESRAGHA